MGGPRAGFNVVAKSKICILAGNWILVIQPVTSYFTDSFFSLFAISYMIFESELLTLL
jgi:hypothetical protein